MHECCPDSEENWGQRFLEGSGTNTGHRKQCFMNTACSLEQPSMSVMWTSLLKLTLNRIQIMKGFENKIRDWIFHMKAKGMAMGIERMENIENTVML